VAAGYNAAAKSLKPEEFDSVVRLYQRRIYRVLFLMVRDSEIADTLTQECFLRAFQKRDSFRGQASLETWLVRIAINLGHDHAKNRRRRFWRLLVRGEEASEQMVADARPSPERVLVAREELAAVWSAVDKLSPQQRTAFLLRFGEEMELEEIAGAMELEIGTVKAHLSRAVSAVKKRFEG
jgi:RNA polymerase sigma-70 factor (ECF subfamily)